jgi:hypothetical protein
MGCWRISRLLLHHLHGHQAPAEAGQVCGVVLAVGFTVLLWLCWLRLVLSSVGLTVCAYGVQHVTKIGWLRVGWYKSVIPQPTASDMLIRNFTNLHLHDLTALHNPVQARALVQSPAVFAPASAFLSALLHHCGRQMTEEQIRMLIVSFSVVGFGSSFEWGDCFGPRTRSETAVIEAAVEFVRVVNMVIEECGVGSTFEPLTAGTMARFGAAADACIATQAAHKVMFRRILIELVELSLERLYRAQYVGEALHAEVNRQIRGLEAQYERLNPGRLAAFRAMH